MKRRIDLRKWSKDGSQRRCNICAKFFDLKELNANNKCKPCNTKAKQAWVNGTTKEFNLITKQTHQKLTQQYFEEKIKKCNTCFNIKSFEEFYPSFTSWDKLQNKCKNCTQEYNNLNNPYSKESNRITRRNSQKKRYHNDIEFRILLNTRNRINKALKCKKNNSTIKILGCSIKYYILYLEKQFDENMSWGNYGIYWEIDHKKPCASFDLTKLEEQQKCFHYTNTQPLSIIENQKKRSKI